MKKTTAKKNHAAKPKASVASKPALDDDEDGDEGEALPPPPPVVAPTSAPIVGRTPKETYQLRMRRMKPHQRVSAKLNATIDRFRHLVDEVASWKNAGELVTTAKTAFAGIEAFANTVAKLPASFEAERPRKAATSSLIVGMRVNLREKHFEDYVDLIDPKDRLKLEVIGIRKGRVACKTLSGEKVLLPRGHVEVINETAKNNVAAKKTEAA